MEENYDYDTLFTDGRSSRLIKIAHVGSPREKFPNNMLITIRSTWNWANDNASDDIIDVLKIIGIGTKCHVIVSQ